MQELLHPAIAGAQVKPLCVEPFVHEGSGQSPQDVGDFQDVLTQSRRVCGRQHAFSAKWRCAWRAPFPAVGRVLVDFVEHPGAQTLGLVQAPLHVPAPFGSPLLLHVQEPVAGDGVHVNLARARLQRLEEFRWKRAPRM